MYPKNGLTLHILALITTKTHRNLIGLSFDLYNEYQISSTDGDDKDLMRERQTHPEQINILQVRQQQPITTTIKIKD